MLGWKLIQESKGGPGIIVISTSKLKSGLILGLRLANGGRCYKVLLAGRKPRISPENCKDKNLLLCLHCGTTRNGVLSDSTNNMNMNKTLARCWHTFECRYNTVQHNTVFAYDQMRLWLRQNMHQKLYSPKAPYRSLSRTSYWVSFVRIWVKINCVIMAQHCITSYATRKKLRWTKPTLPPPHPLELWTVEHIEISRENQLT